MIFLSLFLETGEGREKERKGNINVQDRHQSVASHMPPTGTWPTTPACAPTGIQTNNLSICRTMPNPVTPVKAAAYNFF